MELEKGGNIFPHQLNFPLTSSHFIIIVSDLVTPGLTIVVIIYLLFKFSLRIIFIRFVRYNDFLY